VFQKGDVIEFELPGVINRYCGSLFRCGTVGPASDEIKANAAMITEALFAVIENAKAGRSSHEVHGASKKVFEKHGKGHMLGHRTGYSIGINYAPDWGEGQIMSIWDGDQRPLRAGMTFHLVPGIMILGQYAITISDSILITEGGCEVLTNYPHDLFVC
jgi:Xaa-Pro dipeptidase